MKRNHPGDLRRIVAANIRRLRGVKGLSQQAFALEIEMDRTYLGGVERGERNLSIDNLERIAIGLSVEPWELLREPD
ncbi:XRE family transcriptional regulator [Aureimonas ureilytica]|uniref:XRE family transcriptional regulator n=1 Tax=Aureimonas ureilytica TaxID=401562 RepID=A0A175RD33_9HYPH|nr:helix-turn-helix transcriptional regulator [Aureimonas ureilytica]KTQ98259.1 XRE family transcriptional regulator [Aureimonas ureilytica]